MRTTWFSKFLMASCMSTAMLFIGCNSSPNTNYDPHFDEEGCLIKDSVAENSFKVSIRPRACFSPSYNKVKSQTKHVWLLTLL